MKQQTLAFLIATSLTLLMQQAQAENLLQVYQQAKSYDAQFKALESNYLATLEKKPQALAALKPQVSITGSASHIHQNTFYDATPGTDGKYDTNNVNYSLGMTKSLYNKSLDAQVSQADAIIGQASAGLEAGREALILRAADAYFNCLLAQDNLQFARTEKEAIGRQLEQTRAYFDAGRSAITDVKEAESRYDLTSAQEINAANQLDLAREQLRVITGNLYPSLNAPAANMPLTVPAPQSIDAWVTMAKAKNKQLIASKHAIATAQKTLEIQRDTKKPTVNLFAKQTGSTSAGQPAYDPQAIGASAGVELNMPLYTGGAISSKIREAQHSLRQAQQQYDLQARQTEQQTRNAFLTVQSSISQVKANQQALVSAETAAEATQAGYEVGTRTAVDVLTSLRNVFSARRDYASSRYTYLLNTLNLKQAAGSLTDKDIAAMNGFLTASASATISNTGTTSAEASSAASAAQRDTATETAAKNPSDATMLDGNGSYQYYAAPNAAEIATTKATNAAAAAKPARKTGQE